MTGGEPRVRAGVGLREVTTVEVGPRQVHFLPVRHASVDVSVDVGADVPVGEVPVRGRAVRTSAVWRRRGAPLVALVHTAVRQVHGQDVRGPLVEHARGGEAHVVGGGGGVGGPGGGGGADHGRRSLHHGWQLPQELQHPFLLGRVRPLVVTAVVQPLLRAVRGHEEAGVAVREARGHLHLTEQVQGVVVAQQLVQLHVVLQQQGPALRVVLHPSVGRQ